MFIDLANLLLINGCSFVLLDLDFAIAYVTCILCSIGVKQGI